MRNIVDEKQSGITCPQCGGPMVMQMVKRVQDECEQSWRCSKFPQCEGAALINRPLSSYAPNKIPRSTRIKNTLLSGLLLSYGTFGIYVDEIIILGKREAVKFHGVPAWFMYAAMICASLNMLSVVVDHYDVRDNEINYKGFAQTTLLLACLFFLVGIVLDVFVFKTGAVIHRR